MADYNISYRIYRLRRAFALFAGLQTLGLAGALANGGGQWMPGLIVAAVMSWVLCAALTVRFPHGWLDCVCLSVASALLWFTAPGWFFNGVDPQVVLGMALTGFFGWLCLTWLAGTLLPGLGRAERRYEITWEFPFPLADVKAAVEYREAGYRCGPWSVGEETEEGFLPVSIDHGDCTPPPDASGEVQTSSTYYVKVLEDSDTRRVELASIEIGPDQFTTSVNECTYETISGGTRLTMTEVSDALDALSEFGFWLTDHFADNLSSVEDRLNGLPDRAIRNAPLETPITALAKALTSDPLADRSE